MLVSVGVGAFVSYDYCTQEAENYTLRNCATDTAVNVYNTLWGNLAVRSSGSSTTTGTIETKTFYSEALDRTMQYAIYLPPGYDDPQNGSTRYPVVYLLPGTGGSATAWVTAGGMAEQMDSLLAQGRVQPMILVDPQERSEEFTPNTGYVDGPLGNWATYTTKDLVNEIDSNYRTVESGDGRAVAGYSEGGYGAMNLGLKNPSEYGVIGSFSGYFTPDKQDLSRIFDGDRSLAEANSPMLYLPHLEGKLPVIYFYAGQDDQYLAENQKFAGELQARSASFDFNAFPGSHNWDLWQAHLSDFLIFTSEHLAGGK